MDCINVSLDFEKECFVCDMTNKKCNFIDCQKLCLNFESEDVFLKELEEEE
ncbi:hypothetical protein [Romboutsia sp.]|uniref:hypothetical protein n=1 Tax=Romboutsia sp. TaxID=1965302 RepID=UPI002C91FF89|nr:hypothetical protein [Romboutsia sp.]HSQ88699.1 hypothetical protein [Romboutsia sp.]